MTTTYHAKDPTEIRLSVTVIVWRADTAGAILLVQRSDNGCWGLPGGYVEAGETVEAAAAREVFEETGVEIEVGRLVGVYSDPARQVIAYPDGNRIHAVNLCFEGVPVGQGEPTTPEETLAIGYFEAGSLPDPFVPIHEIRIRDVLAREPEAAVR